MTSQRAIEILKTERACASRTDCDRGCCRECDLVLESTAELIETYDFVIKRLEDNAMVIHKCDRCGAETDNPHTIFYEADITGAASKSAELCDGCYDSFKAWLKGDVFTPVDYESHWREVTDKTERNGG